MSIAELPELSHGHAFDPTYGYSLDALLAIEPPPEPDDFESFWRGTHDEVMAVPLRIDVSTPPSPVDGFSIRLVHFDGLDIGGGTVRLGAWLIEPTDGPVERFVVAGHGYYNRPLEDVWYTPGVATLFFACRGLGLSRVAGVSDQTAFHVLHGIDAKETYVHRGCVADTWLAASAMLEIFPQAAGRLEYFGESFGGGIGAMALAWDRRFAFAQLRVPSFGHMPIRLNCRCAGSGEAVRRKWERSPVLYEKTLRYFDAASHARRVTTPTHVACALFDPAVPPPGQFAVYNAMPGPKKLYVLRTGHHDWPGYGEDVRRADAEADAFRRNV